MIRRPFAHPSSLRLRIFSVKVVRHTNLDFLLWMAVEKDWVYIAGHTQLSGPPFAKSTRRMGHRAFVIPESGRNNRGTSRLSPCFRTAAYYYGIMPRRRHRIPRPCRARRFGYSDL